jgi:pimeloyl-ACP methyl ester carboxylesterase
LRDTEVRPACPASQRATLVLHRRGDRAVRIEAGRHLAGAIPGARLVELDGDDHWLWAGNQRQVLQQIRGFVGCIEGWQRSR